MPLLDKLYPHLIENSPRPLGSWKNVLLLSIPHSLVFVQSFSIFLKNIAAGLKEPAVMPSTDRKQSAAAQDKEKAVRRLILTIAPSYKISCINIQNSP
jgi:hypothetical protein